MPKTIGCQPEPVLLILTMSGILARTVCCTEGAGGVPRCTEENLL